MPVNALLRANGHVFCFPLIKLLLLIPTNYQKRYERIQIKLTTLHNNKRTIELLQGCIDYNIILASQMLLIYQNYTLTSFLRYFRLS